MGLSKQLGQKITLLKGHIGLLSSLVLLSACTSLSSQPDSKESAAKEAPTKAPIQAEAAKVKTVPNLPLTAELTYLIITAEIAAQRGDILSAAELYSRAAQTVDSPNLASRSAQVANFTRDQHRIERALERWGAVSPDEPNVYMLKTPFLLLRGQLDQARETVNHALKLAPENSAQFLARLADNLSKTTQAEPALKLFSGLDPYQQGKTEALFHFARLAALYEQFDVAIDNLTQLLEKAPKWEQAIILKAKILQQLDDGEAALDVIAPAAKAPDASRLIRYNYGQLLGENNLIEQSRQVFEQLEQQQSTADTIFALGVIAIEQKRGDDAKGYFQKLLKFGDPHQQAPYFLGLAEKISGNVDEALTWFASIPKRNARFQAAQNHYVTLLADNGALAKARLHLAELRTRFPELAVQYYLFESVFLRERNLEKSAYDLLSQALKEYPQNIDLLYGRAMAAEAIDKVDLLEKDLRKILAIEPKHAQSLNALGYTLTDRTSRHQEALVLINQAIALKPNDPFFLDSLGWVYYRLGNLEKAEQYLKQAVEIETDAAFYAHLGEVLWQKGQRRAAKKVWQQGLDFDADNPLLLKTMKQFGL